MRKNNEEKNEIKKKKQEIKTVKKNKLTGKVKS